MKKGKALWSIILVIVLLMGCGMSKDEVASEDMNISVESDRPAEDSGDFKGYGEVDMELKEENTSSVASNRKIIHKIYMDVETKEFDDLLKKLNEEIGKAGGYVERSSVSGNSYSYEGNRYAELVIRVPADKSNSFSEFVSAHSTVTNKEIGTDDVTLSYIDMESRVSALETEKEALENLLAKADKLEDIIVIQERLTNVIYEIESYKSQLRTYDNLIEYTTITVSVSEVERVTIVEEQTVWEEIRTKLGDNVGDIGEGVVDIFIFLTSNIPYILIIGVVAFVAVKIAKKFKKQ